MNSVMLKLTRQIILHKSLHTNLPSCCYASIKRCRNNSQPPVFTRQFCVKVNGENSQIFSPKIEAFISSHQQTNPNKSVTELCQFLLKFEVEEDVIRVICNARSDCDVNLQQLEHIADILKRNNIDISNMVEEVSFFDIIAGMEPRSLEEKLAEFDAVKIGMSPLTIFVESWPIILLMDTAELKKRLGLIVAFFPPKEMRHLIKFSPNILSEPWESIVEKIYYIQDEMGLDQPHMSYNKSLSHSLNHIRNRFEFLNRLGRYQKPKLYRNRLSHLVNDSMADIMDTDDFTFCKRVAKVSQEEWFTFQELMRLEMKEAEEGGVSQEEEEHQMRTEMRKNQRKKHLNDPYRKK